MKKIFLKLFLGLFLAVLATNTRAKSYSTDIVSDAIISDTLENQVLYKGRIWRNVYRKIEGNQFFITDEFMSGSVSIEGTTYGNLEVRYDIYTDEILIISNNDIIIQLNKEMVDSFSVRYLNSVHHFRQIRNDSIKVAAGFVDVLYNGKVSLVVKYMKKINPVSAFKEYDNFFQTHRIFIERDGEMLVISSKNDVLKLFPDKRQEIKEFVRSNRVRVRKDIPESFIPLVAFCNTLTGR